MIIRGNQATDENTQIERRQQRRITCSEPTFFLTQNRIQEVVIKDIGENGVCIESDAAIVVGQAVTVAVPTPDRNGGKRRGKIVWVKPNGFGVQFD